MSKDESYQYEATFWEECAKTRWGIYLSEIEKGAILKANELSVKPGKGLEIGCEGGRWSVLLTDLGWKMICTDINPETLAICQKRIPTAKCILVDSNDKNIPCDTASLELLLCIEVPVITCDWFIKEAHRVLKPGGILVGSVENSFSYRAIGYRLLSLFDPKRRRLNHLYKLSYAKWRSLAQRSGFNMSFEEGYCWPTFTRHSDSHLIPLLSRVERWIGLHRLPVISPWVACIMRKSF
jgi:ubiquinone/menaquinone biosynthesis C-methylase UbiE